MSEKKPLTGMFWPIGKALFELLCTRYFLCVFLVNFQASVGVRSFLPFFLINKCIILLKVNRNPNIDHYLRQTL